jgi:hypothetical protein
MGVVRKAITDLACTLTQLLPELGITERAVLGWMVKGVLVQAGSADFKRASVLPSSTPHWSKELVLQVTAITILGVRTARPRTDSFRRTRSAHVGY